MEVDNLKLSEYAKEKGVTYQTAYNLFKAGSIDNAIQIPTGTIVINEDKPLVSKHRTKHKVDQIKKDLKED